MLDAHLLVDGLFVAVVSALQSLVRVTLWRWFLDVLGGYSRGMPWPYVHPHVG